jgi:hypothetical protein
MKIVKITMMLATLLLSFTAVTPLAIAQSKTETISSELDKIEERLSKTDNAIHAALLLDLNIAKSKISDELKSENAQQNPNIKDKLNNLENRCKSLQKKLETPLSSDTKLASLTNTTSLILSQAQRNSTISIISCTLFALLVSSFMWFTIRYSSKFSNQKFGEIETKLNSIVNRHDTLIKNSRETDIGILKELQANLGKVMLQVNKISTVDAPSSGSGLTEEHSNQFFNNGYNKGVADSADSEAKLLQNLSNLESEVSELTASIDILRESESVLKQNMDSRDRELEESVKRCQAAYQASIRNGLVPELPYKVEELNSLLSSLTSQAASSIISVEGESLNESVNAQAKNIGVLFASAVSGETRSAQRLLDPIPLNAYEFSREFWNDSLIAKNKLELAKHIALNLLTSHGYQLIQPVPGIDTISMQFHDERSQIETFDPKLVGKIASVRAPGLTFNGEIIRKAFVVQYVQGTGKPPAPVQVPIIPENASEAVSQQITTMNEGVQPSTPEVQTAPFEQNPIDNLILSRTAIDSTPDVPELPQESVQPNSLQDVQASSNLTEVTNQTDHHSESNPTVMPNEFEVEESHPVHSPPQFSGTEEPNFEEERVK